MGNPDPEPCCPGCGREVFWDFTCHTYGPDDSGKFWACLNCDSAIEYTCETCHDDRDAECGWGYIHGLNPKNPRAVLNEKYRPPWLPPVPEYRDDRDGGRTQIVPRGVKARWIADE